MKHTMVKIVLAVILAVLLTGATADSMAVRVKDLAAVRGVRDNQLIGYGLVVGLNGTGDSNKAAFTLQSVANMLAGFGVRVSENDMKLKNVAAVMVTATIPAFAGNGDLLDITVSSLGDAKTLEGGVLLQTPLKAANGNVYAVGQGSLTIGGFNVSTGASAGQRNHVTVGRIPNGAIVERDLRSEFVSNGTLELVLRDADFTTAGRLAAVIAARYGAGAANALDAGRIVVKIPAEFANNAVGFIAQLENLSIEPDAVARVIVNERTGTVVLGGQVRLGSCAVSHGTLHIRITTENTTVTTEPATDEAATAPGATRTTATRQAQDVTMTQDNRLLALPEGTSVTQVVDALNAVGAGPRDIIAVLQAIDQAGALHAELVVM